MITSKSRRWDKFDYLKAAQEFVLSYGSNSHWDELVNEYCASYEALGFRLNADVLVKAISRGMRSYSRSQVNGTLTMDD